ncbi:MAG: family 43 glycosylhydrolase [Oscillospiraceae bacterium]|nr:family 43 glycosylhydrolase [Oscillospiraceae bacterium]
MCLSLGSCSSPRFDIGRAVRTSQGAVPANVTGIRTKALTDSNPIISNIFCADPTSIEYDGRLYIYGTCDHQQYEAVGADGENTYEHIRSLVVLSTDDMANYTYHGRIPVGEIAPWIMASWAPSVVSRTEDDGRTHFYMYFSDSGRGTGVITAESPLGPWSDPLGKPLIDGRTKGLQGCKVPFDPGACIDDDGTGWLTFGGLGKECGRIVKLGSDMVSLDSEIVKLPAKHHFEANELNFINGTYVYTYNTNWESHLEGWDTEKDGMPPPTCSMAYMTSKTPLDPDSWEYRDYYFKNPGEQGMEYSNNHTHLQKYGGRYYLFYHSQFMQRLMGTSGGFRSICVDEAAVDEDTLTIEKVDASKKGTEQIKYLDPYSPVEAETAAVCAGIGYEQTADGMYIKAECGGDAAWSCVRGADLGDGSGYIAAKAKGHGTIEVRTGAPDGETAAVLCFDSDDMQTVYADMHLSGVNDLFFVISDGIVFDSWQVK